MKLSSIHPRIYLASVALEPNRWKAAEQKLPTFQVSEWSQAALTAGFDGWELWENHWFKATEAERDALCESALAVCVFNTYLRPGIDSDTQWQQVVDAVHRLGPRLHGIKFNLGKELIPAAEQIAAANRWAQMLPDTVSLLCECHSGTIMETAATATAAFAAWQERIHAIIHPMACEPAPVESWLDVLGKHIQHVHWQARGVDNKLIALERALPQVRAILQTLASLQFSGTHSIEFVEGTGCADESHERLFAAACADLRTLRRSIA